MARPNSPEDQQVRQAALDLAVRSYEHFKNHARFAETQRSWLLIPYLGVAGAIGAAVLRQIVEPGDLDPEARRIATIGIAALIVAGALIWAAIIKLAVVFDRHYGQAEDLVAAFRDRVEDSDLRALLQLAMLPPLGKAAGGRKHFGVSAAHNYLFSFLLAFETAAIAGLHEPKPASVGAVFLVAGAAAIMGGAILRWYLEPGAESPRLGGEEGAAMPEPDAGPVPDPPDPKPSGG